MVLRIGLDRIVRAGLLLAVLASQGAGLAAQAGTPGEPTGQVRHVIIVGVDGMSPDGVRKADTPHMHALMAGGSWTLHARGVLPTSSAANWASMLTGAGPEQHGVTDNKWGATQFKFPTMVTGSGGFFPSIFQLIAEQRPRWHAGSIHEWDGFGALYDHRFVDYDAHGKDADETAELAVEYIQRRKPEFLIVHLDLVDDAGHTHGHGTPGYYSAVAKADELLGRIQQAIGKAGIAHDSVLLVTSDHGGVGKGHGGESLAELEIPWIASGVSIRRNNQLAIPVNTFDTPATVAHLLGLEIPYAWIGRPVTAAIQGQKVPRQAYPLSSTAQPPTILPENNGGQSPSGGLFTTPTVTVTIENPNKGGEVRYTTDGSFPSAGSTRYAGPFDIDASAIVRAMVFVDGKAASTVSDGNFRLLRDPALHGVRYSLYLLPPPLARLPDFSRLTPASTGLAPELSLNGLPLPREDGIAIAFEGRLQLPTSGTWSFKTASDDGSKLYIDGKLVVENDGTHGIIEATGSVEVAAGEHDIRVEYFNDGGGSWLGAWFEGPQVPRQYIDPNWLTPPR